MIQKHENLFTYKKSSISIEELLLNKEKIIKADKIRFKKNIIFETPLDYFYFEYLIYISQKDKKISLVFSNENIIELEHTLNINHFKKKTNKKLKNNYNYHIKIKDFQEIYSSSPSKKYLNNVYRNFLPVENLQNNTFSIITSEVMMFLKRNKVEDKEVATILGELIDNVYSHAKGSKFLFINIYIEGNKNSYYYIETSIFDYGEDNKSIPDNIRSIIDEQEYIEFKEYRDSLEFSEEYTEDNFYHNMAFSNHVTTRKDRKDNEDSGVGLSRFLELLEKTETKAHVGYTISGKSKLLLTKEMRNNIELENRFLIKPKYFLDMQIPFHGTTYFYGILIENKGEK